jgi:hypothetical protein
MERQRRAVDQRVVEFVGIGPHPFAQHQLAPLDAGQLDLDGCQVDVGRNQTQPVGRGVTDFGQVGAGHQRVVQRFPLAIADHVQMQ